MKFEVGPSSDNAADFLKIKGGQTVRGIFRGEPKTFSTHWTGQFSELCTGNGSCAHCSKGEKPKFRFRLNFLMPSADGTISAKIWEQGRGVYNQLRDLNVEYPLESTIVTIKRTGEGVNDTSYTIIPAKDGAVSPALEAKLAAVALIDLSPVAAKPQAGAAPAPKHAAAPQAAVTPPFDADMDIPF